MSTKKLAKELGLLRQRSQTSAGTKKSAVSNQMFSHLIVIDFESTCWREKTNYSQEIIEFPAVLLNTSTGEIESEFHTYVQPQEHPILSKFCTELTGITQRQVEAGIPLQICLSQFSRWLQHLQREMGLVFPSSQHRSSEPSPSQKQYWDLGVCLQYECKRKQLHKPDVLNSWIDLRSTYRLFYDRKPKGLNGALQDLGIQFSGREHSGLDDSRNTAKLASRMMRDGCVMKITRSLERASSTVKPMFRNTTADEKKNPGTNKKENPLSIHRPSSSRSPLTLCHINSYSEITTNIDTKENLNSALAPVNVNVCQSLISPQTLLNGTNTSLWGCSSRSVKKETANLSSSVTINCISPNSNCGNSVVLCPTILDGYSNLPQPQQLSETVATVGLEDNGELLVETERCGSYDEVVLECDDIIDDTEYISAFDSGCYVWEEPECSYSARNLFTISDKVRPGMKTTHVPTKMSRSHIITSAQPHVMRQHSVVSEPNTHSAVNTSVPLVCETNQQKNIQKTPSPFKPKSFVPENTSTPNVFAKPKPVSQQKHRPAPKSSFTIYTDVTKQAATPSHPSSCNSLYTSNNVLSTLSTNTRSSSTSSSSFLPFKFQGGGKVTAPLCACGRRAKRQLVSNGGPNQGRGFYCCPVRRSGSGSRIQKGCDFFKWESSLSGSSLAAGPPVRSSVSLCQFNSLVDCHPQNRLRKSC
ncbi:ERI1 exoribonuclease 2 isoform X2 [Betta splendens]|uniref:ERI1 exoribonuclease 2 n=1 Tax=Betta splendens TaxID=158456 RepID=A0A8M1HHI7_BETSP|nr:ERI1 exoribonuclease 2 isoform X2 [Betta splendens]